MEGVLLEGCFSRRTGGKRGRSNGVGAVGLELTAGGTGLGEHVFWESGEQWGPGLCFWG